MTYEEFQKALEELAPKRFRGGSKEEALQSIFRLVEGKEPTNAGVTVRKTHFSFISQSQDQHLKDPGAFK